jgi:hypothetical protein
MFGRFIFFAMGSLMIPTTTSHAQRSEPSATLIELWKDANSRCQDGPSNSPSCFERDRLGIRLDSVDWCYYERDKSFSEMSWHICSSDSVRPASSPRLGRAAGVANQAADTQRSEPGATLIELWNDANSRCGGGCGNSNLPESACSERERMAVRLAADALGSWVRLVVVRV